MNALLRKEIRLLLPAWSAAMLAAVVTDFSGPPGHAPDFLYPLCGITMVLLGISAFGLEFSHGTFSLLLAQPVPRSHLWRAKAGVLAAAFGSLWITFSLPWLSDPLRSEAQALPVFSGLFLLAIFASALWTTLVCRQMAAAFWCAPLMPVTAGIVALVVQKFSDSETVINAAVITTIVLQAIVVFVLARRHFLYAEDTLASPLGVAIPVPSSLRFLNWFRGGQQWQPLRASLAREIQSHHVALFLAAILFPVHLAALAIWRLAFAPAEPPVALGIVVGICWLLWLCLPLLIGASAIAEERRQGTLEVLLCLPTTRRAQFALKWIVALPLGVVLGGIAPWFMEKIGEGLGDYPALNANGPSGAVLIFAVLLAFHIVLLAFYASSLTRNLLQALAAAVATAIVLSSCGIFITSFPAFHHFATEYQLPLWSLIAPPVLAIILSVVAYFNFKQPQIAFDHWLRNAIALTVVAVLILIATLWVGSSDLPSRILLTQPQGLGAPAHPGGAR